ncbi:ER lumen protein-retaining receptor 3 [Larimichthys crocea]|uniref:Uncharacterized protein n=1 Tax=Larimichthys crocea TaxID=215358 RepID=A0ACD3R7C6_LARCR|nr:ER lumen protein-retaining receptor 3 [Larimichthys crocea]
MNVFRLAGDVSHLVAIIILLLKIWRSKSCAGISGKSQVLFALVFTTRYLDLFTVYISAYNTVMKVVFLALSYATVYLIYMRFRKMYDSENDTFRIEFLLVPVIGLSFLENYAFTPMEILWTFSIFLEAVAIMPQLFMITKTGEAGVHHHPLPVLPWPLPSSLHSQLGVALPHGGLLRPDRRGVRRRCRPFSTAISSTFTPQGCSEEKET